MLIAHAVPQRDAATGGDLIGIYLCNAKEGPASEMKSRTLEYTVRMHAQSTPSRMINEPSRPDSQPRRASGENRP